MTESFRRARMAAATLALTACLSLGAFAGPALAATVRANVSIAGAGMVTGPQSDCVNTNQNDRIVKSDCDQQVVVNDPLPVDATMTLTAAPSNFPAGQWKLVRWEGCASTSGATCTVTGPAFSSKTWDVRAVFADATPPTITSGPTVTYSGVADRTVSFSYSYNEVVPTVQCQIDGGAFGGCQSTYVLSEGSHTIGVRAFDSSGNVSATSTAPVTIVDTALTAGPAQGSLSNSRSDHFGYSTVGGNSFECSLDGAAFASCPTTGADYSGLADGAHTFAVRARNGGFFDHVAATRNWTIDATPPQTTLDPASGPADGSVVTAPTATFGFSSSESGSFQCSLDGQGFAPCTTPQAFSGLAWGQHTFAVRAVDAAGNPDPTPATRAWTVAAPDNDHDGYDAAHDCNDGDPSINPGAAEIVDNAVDENCDGILGGTPDADHDGYNAAHDCNDGDPSINPGAAEIPDNAVDENCDGVVGINLDRDGDGAQRPLDCDDTNAAIHPGAVDTPDDGVDQDCTGTDAHVAPRPLDKLSVALAYFGKFGTKSARFTQLSVKSVPAGATVTVTCKGKGCPRAFVKRNAANSVCVKPLLRKPLRPGATITIVVSKPNAISAVKVLKIRAGKKPTIATRCQPPGATVASSC